MRVNTLKLSDYWIGLSNQPVKPVLNKRESSCKAPPYRYQRIAQTDCQWQELIRKVMIGRHAIGKPLRGPERESLYLGYVTSAADGKEPVH